MGWNFDALWAMPCEPGFPIFLRDAEECIGTFIPNTPSHTHQILNKDGNVNILGLKWNSRVRIFDTVGALVKDTYTTGGLQTYLPEKGVYIVEIQHENNREVVKIVNR